jgi:hypothetical protein
MNTFFSSLSSLNPWRRAARFAPIFMVFIALCAAASAQTPPYALLQNSVLNGTGNTFTATHLPVVNAVGKTIYVDLTVQFDVAADGTLTVSTGYPQQVRAPNPIIDGFLAGTYLGPDDSTEFISVTGPGVTLGGATEWAISPGPKYIGCLYPYNATWYDVGTKITNSPIYARLLKAGIKTTQYWQYGVGSSNCSVGAWGTNSLLGFSQIGGNTFEVTSFTNNGVDQSTPVVTKTYRLQP